MFGQYFFVGEYFNFAIPAHNIIYASRAVAAGTVYAFQMGYLYEEAFAVASAAYCDFAFFPVFVFSFCGIFFFGVYVKCFVLYDLHAALGHLFAHLFGITVGQ